MPSGRVLIVGAGVAGSIAAFWLAKHDYEVVVIERSKAEQKAGQGIEIEEPATQVVKMMGIFDKLNSIRTGELGAQIEDEQARVYAQLDAGGISPTGQLELMRGDLTEVLYKAADEASNVTYYFETTIRWLQQIQDKVIVELRNRKDGSVRTEEFDMVIGADGAKSKTREFIMGTPEEIKCYHDVGAYVAYFSIKKQEHDWPRSRLCQFPDRRVIWIRPTTKNSDTTSVYLIHLKNKIPALDQANATGDRQKQKEAFAKIYSGLGWETPSIVEQITKADNFYSDKLQQVKLPTWSQNRVVLLGDAAWAPTPFTGEGNQLAIIGAWVLAQEMSRNRGPVAFHNYEKRFRKYVENAQDIPLRGYAPYIACPQTWLGIWTFRTSFMLLGYAIKFFSWANLSRFWPAGATKEELNHAAFDLEAESVS